jgi:hypothetical protein
MSIENKDEILIDHLTVLSHEEFNPLTITRDGSKREMPIKIEQEYGEVEYWITCANDDLPTLIEALQLFYIDR